MRMRLMTCTLAVVVTVLTSQSASACHTCRQTPCVMPQPAYQCVTEMVPYTVYKTKWRTEYETCTKTVMVREPVTNYVERQRVVCKPVYDTIEIPCQRVVCKPIHETDYVTQTYTVCKPVQTTQQVTTYCMQPTTQYVTVPTGRSCGLCHKDPCGCKTVACTTYTRVPVVKDVVCTTMVPETRTRQVPIHRTRYEREVINDVKKITKCRMVQEVVTQKVPCVTWVCVPKTVTKQIPHKVCEQVAVTCYKPVKRMVPCTYAAAPAVEAVPSMQSAPSSQSAPAPSKQSSPSATMQATPTKQG
jgi:YTV